MQRSGVLPLEDHQGVGEVVSGLWRWDFGRWGGGCVAVLVLALFASPATLQADDAPDRSAASPLASWLEGDYLTGTWGGRRTTLADLGIEVNLFSTIDVQGNPIGGVHQAVRYFQYTGLEVAVGLDTLIGWPGARFQVSGYWGSGRSLSQDIRNVFTVAETCCVASVRLVDLWIEQSLASDLVNIRLGRVAAGDEFMTLPVFLSFVQGSINANPSAIFFNVPFSAYPLPTWGARVRVTPVERFYLMAGAYNGDPEVEDLDNHGTDSSLAGPLFAIGEIGYRLNQEKDPTGLPGTYKAGVFYHDGLYPRVLNRIAGSPVFLPNLGGHVSRGNGGFYALAEQMVYRGPAGASPWSVTPFLSVLISPDQDKNPIPYFVNAGVVSQGLIPRRPNDTALFGVAWGRFSDAFHRLGRLGGGAIGVPRDEVALEWGYAIQVTPWFKVQPDIQYIIRPGGTGRIPNALVLGFEIGVVF